MLIIITRGGGISYGISNDSITLGRIEQNISAAFPEISSFSPIYAYIITWNNVGYFDQNADKVSLIECV